jgi:hypothetical protein
MKIHEAGFQKLNDAVFLECVIQKWLVFTRSMIKS